MNIWYILKLKEIVAENYKLENSKKEQKNTTRT